MEIHGRCLGRIRKVDDSGWTAHDDNASLHWIFARSQGRDGAGRLLEDNQELEEHEGGKAKRLLLVLHNLRMVILYELFAQALQADEQSSIVPS